MKNVLVLAVAAVVSLLIGGCGTLSLNGLATPETVIADPDLVGRWTEADKPDSAYVITQGGEKDYRVTFPAHDGKKAQEYAFVVVKLADSRFMDLTMTKGAMEEISDKYGSLVIPTHTFMKIKRKGDSLIIWDVKYDWLNDGLKTGEIKLAHATLDEGADNSKDTYVLTGSTSELQRFFRLNAEAENAFDKPTTLRRDHGDETSSGGTKARNKTP